MEKKSRKSIIISASVLLLITLVLLGLTYAYYRTRIVGNEDSKSMSLVSEALEVTYSDDKSVIEASDVEPGKSYTKEFTVTNTGDEAVNYSIVLDNVENTFIRKEDWTYTLYRGDTVNESNIITSGIVPSSKTWIVNSREVTTSETFTIKIAYANLTDVDQSEDMGKTLSLRINIDNEIGGVFTNAAGGTLLAAIGNDNIISEPLTVPGKENTVLTYQPLMKGTRSFTADEKYNRYVAYSDEYVFDEQTGLFSLVNPQIMDLMTNSTNLIGKYSTFFYNNANSAINNSVNMTTIQKITNASTPEYSYEWYAKTSKDKEKTLSIIEDDYGTSYYYRGTVENNYVNYSRMCWRIVRVQGDGTIKLTLADENGECNADTYSLDNISSAYINNASTYSYSDYDDVTYLRGNIPSILETWSISKGIAQKNEDNSVTFKENIVKAEYCNDTSIDRENTYDFGGDYWVTDYYYGAYNRLRNKETISPSLKCDFAGINNSKSTKIESYIALLTADEIALAGALTFNMNDESFLDYYLMTNASLTPSFGGYYWTMTPVVYESEGSWSSVDTVYSSGELSYRNVYNQDDDEGYYIRPAIVLRSDVLATTNSDTSTYGQPGTQTNPYVVS